MSPKLWNVVLSMWLVGCAGSAPSLRSRDGSLPAVVTRQEACRSPTALVLLCGEHACAFYRCQEVARLESAPLDAAPAGRVVLARGVVGVAPPPDRAWGPEPIAPEDRAPVFVVPWKPPPTYLLPPGLRAEAEQLARLPHTQHHIFPPEEEFRAWFASKGITPEAWTTPVVLEDYFRIHAGALGGLWNVAWREFMQGTPQATPMEVWSYAGELFLRFGIFESGYSNLPSIASSRVVDEDALVTFVDIDPATQARADKALTVCADLASREVLVRRMNGRAPTPRECFEQVARDSKGQPVTRAMQLGIEMHRVALECARKKLSELYPLGFSIEPRYRYNSKTERTIPVSPELEQALLRQGLGRELLGTIVPDVVLHTGNPARVQAVYDFKFPCVDTKGIPSWGEYPEGHPYQERFQGDIYEKALGAPPARITPRKGIIR